MYKKRDAWMDECSLMLLAGPGSAFSGEIGGGRDDSCPTIDFVEQCQVMHPVARLQ